MDWIPGVSQAKSLVQLARGDVEGAKKTHENFMKDCPGMTQMKTSVSQVVAGDTKGAIETQKQLGNDLLRMADGIPGVGTAKGLINYAWKATERTDPTLESAAQTATEVSADLVASGNK